MKASTLSLLLSFIIHVTAAQEEQPIILKAMQDEQQRSMKELKLDGHEPPFYISYSINDSKKYFYSASMGSLVRSDSTTYRGKNTRVLVGDYDFNDESLDNNIFSSRLPSEIDLPLEDDYAGIRRSLWVTTDGIYRSAAKHFKENKNLLKEKGKPLSEIPHRRFARVQPQQVNHYKNFETLNHSSLESYVKELSGYLKNQQGVTTAKVMLSVTRGHQYFANTEGTWYITPSETILLNITVATGFGWLNTKQFSGYYPNLSSLPSVDQMKELNEFLKSENKTSENKKIENKIKEDYTGPILFTNQIAAKTFMALFYRDGLIANNNLEVENRYRIENPSAFENKIGKQVVAESITIKAKSKLNRFGNIPLLGSYEVDKEGVAPPDEILLIKNGVLTNLLNDRSLTKVDQQANGHADGPGVIEVTCEDSQNIDELKKILITKAREEGNDYAYMTKDISLGYLNTSSHLGPMGMGLEWMDDFRMFEMGLGAGFGSIQFIRIDLATGNEEIVSDMNLQNISIKNFKKIRASNGPLKAYNLPMGFGSRNVISVMCPEAILLEGLELTPNRLIEPEAKESVFVDPPKK